MNDINYNIKSMSIFSFRKNIGETMLDSFIINIGFNEKNVTKNTLGAAIFVFNFPFMWGSNS